MSSRLRRFTLSCAIACAALGFSPSTLAQNAAVEPDPGPGSVYLGGSGFWHKPDTARNAEDNGFGGRAFLGVPLARHFIFELGGFGLQTERETTRKKDASWGVGGDLLIPFTGPEAGFRPFINLGGGYIQEHILGEEEGAGYADAGLGAMIRLGEGVYLRPDARYMAVFNDLGATDEDPLYDLQVGLGIQGNLGRTERVTDVDGDGVPDNADSCPNTPRGVQVDTRGCPLDSDGDGVADAVDQCPNTPRGTAVDARGCPLDSDGDGVVDNQDRCPNTPRGVIVDATGCPADADRDGVPDHADKCPNTPQGLKVDNTGCVRTAQTLVLRNVNFEFNKATLTPDSRGVLVGVAQGLVSDPDMVVELAGHTDSIGSDRYNLNLSQRRADAVRSFLISQGVPPRRLIAKGYGESVPVASNATESGRAQNRRVEFRVLVR